MPPSVHPIKRSPLGRQIASAIREDILFGQRPPGTHLTQQELCQHYGTSRIPVRDALRDLAHSGHIITDAAGRSVVAPMDRKGLREIYLIQGILHGLATRMVTETATQADIEQLVDLHGKMVLAEESANPSLMADINFIFHRKINYLADSEPLLAVIKILAKKIPPHYATRMPKWMHRANQEHAEVIAAIAKRNADEAARLMQAHVAGAVEDLILYLQGKGFEFSPN